MVVFNRSASDHRIHKEPRKKTPLAIKELHSRQIIIVELLFVKNFWVCMHINIRVDYNNQYYLPIEKLWVMWVLKFWDLMKPSAI